MLPSWCWSVVQVGEEQAYWMVSPRWAAHEQLQQQALSACPESKGPCLTWPPGKQHIYVYSRRGFELLAAAAFHPCPPGYI